MRTQEESTNRRLLISPKMKQLSLLTSEQEPSNGCASEKESHGTDMPEQVHFVLECSYRGAIKTAIWSLPYKWMWRDEMEAICAEFAASALRDLQIDE